MYMMKYKLIVYYVILCLIIYILYAISFEKPLSPETKKHIEELAESQIRSIDKCYDRTIINANCIHIKIENYKIQNISNLSSRGSTVYYFIKNLINKYNVKESDFIVGLEDAYNDINASPFFVFSKNKYLNNQVLIPDAYAMEFYYNELLVKDTTKFSEKINKCIFAGSSTGNLLPELNTRLLFCNWSLSNQQISQCYITNVVQIPRKNILDTFSNAESFLVERKISIKEQKKYKFIVNIDGNTCGWDRLPWILNSNSICLKKNSDNICWYYNLLKNKVHYLEFNKFNEIPYLTQLDTSLYLSIIANANLFVKNFLTIEAHEYYMFCIIKMWNKYILKLD